MPSNGHRGREVRVKVVVKGAFYGNRTLPSLNDYLKVVGTNPIAGGKFKADYSIPLVNAIRRCLKGWKVTNPPIIIHYTFYESNKGVQRDVMNIFSLCDKYFEDALQRCGVIENDNPKWVANTTHEFFWIDGEPFIEIEIEEIGQCTDSTNEK